MLQMKKDKTIKRDFYLLVVKVFLSTILSSAVTYLCLIYFIFMFTENNMIKPTDYFVKYLDVIEKKIEESAPDILNGELINLDQYSEKIEGEVLDINGNHLYGDQDVAGYKVKVGEVINREIVKGSYVYRFIPIKHDNAIQAVYVLKAPFGFITNNQDRLGIVLIYVVLLISPLIFFVIYLIFYTSKLYKSLFNNIKVLLQASDKISKGDFDFKISGLKRKEFMRIKIRLIR